MQVFTTRHKLDCVTNLAALQHGLVTQASRPKTPNEIRTKRKASPVLFFNPRSLLTSRAATLGHRLLQTGEKQAGDGIARFGRALAAALSPTKLLDSERDLDHKPDMILKTRLLLCPLVGDRLNSP